MVAVSRPNQSQILESEGEDRLPVGSERESAGGMGWAGLGWAGVVERVRGRLFGEVAGSVTAGNWSLTIEGAPGKRRHASMGECCRGQDPRTHADGFPRLMGTWGPRA